MKYLIVVDMQNDFIDGALGTKEAAAIVPYVKSVIENFDGKVFFTVTKPQVIGTFSKVRINDSLEYDLLGEMEEEGE